MKILHISYDSCNGAGLAALRINKSLNDIGVESRLLVLYEEGKKDNVKGVWSYRKVMFHEAFHKILRLLHIYIYEKDKLIRLSKINSSIYTRPITSLDISNHSWVDWADIIHFHWVDNFFDQQRFLIKTKKPIVWTVHDEGLFYGISHFGDAVDMDNALEKKYRIIKEQMIKRSNIKFVFLTNYFYIRFNTHHLLKNKQIYVIPNSVNPNLYKPYKNRALIRKSIGVDDKTILLSFVAGMLSDPHKGLENVINATRLFPSKKIKILAIGNNRNFKATDNVITVGVIDSPEQMAKLYSASDFYVMASLQESFSQSCIEAMSCGIPVIATPTGVSEELITEENGICCSGFDINSLETGLKKALNRKYDREIIRKSIIDRYAPSLIAKKYIDVYSECLR